MPWYGWLLVAIFVLFALAAITMRILRTSRRGRRFRSLSLRAKIDFARTLMTDPSVPVVNKVILGILVGYLAMPFDLIPDFIPVVGQLDDVLVVSLAMVILMKTVPPDRFEAAMLEAERREVERAREARPEPRERPPLPPG